MDDLGKQNLLFPFYMLGGMLAASGLAEAKLLRWETASETGSFAKAILLFCALGLSYTFYSWLSARQFKISILWLMGLMTFVSIAIASPSIGIVFGLIFIVYERHGRKQFQKETGAMLNRVQWLTFFWGCVYVAATAIQLIGGSGAVAA